MQSVPGSRISVEQDDMFAVTLNVMLWEKLSGRCGRHYAQQHAKRHRTILHCIGIILVVRSSLMPQQQCDVQLNISVCWWYTVTVRCPVNVHIIVQTLFGVLFYPITTSITVLIHVHVHDVWVV